MRAPPLLLLLLMAAAGLAESPLARLNPWLSACDLEQEGAGGWRECGACGGGGGGPALATHDVTRLCGLSASARALRLKELRLRACCERSPASALDHAARLDVQQGGPSCELQLNDLLKLDNMVAQVHCDFVDILNRYDCDQSYSLHTCKDCQETYRRWACSTMVPLWVEEGVEETGRSRRTAPERGERGSRWRARHLERVGHLDRRRGGSLVRRWVRAAAAGPGRPLARLKPCLSVCQLVETHCPYFLPGDRAPAYPTQYAGEPTFLCLDARIPETGATANKSNYGPDDCCYWHCGGKLCYQCDVKLVDVPRPTSVETCSIVEERIGSCTLLRQAAREAAAAASATKLAVPTVPLLVLATSLALLAARPSRWTAPPLVTVRGSRL